MRVSFIGSLWHVKHSLKVVPEDQLARFAQAGNELGREAVRRGAQILVGSDHEYTLDRHVVDGALEEIRNHEGQTLNIHVFDSFGEGNYPFQRHCENEEQAKHLRFTYTDSYDPDASQEHQWIVTYLQIVDQADAHICVGGGSTAQVIAMLALNRAIPFICIPGFGGTAHRVSNRAKMAMLMKAPEMAEKINSLFGPWSDSDASLAFDVISSTAGDNAHEAHSYFISYSTKDAGVADHVETLLWRAQREVFRDETRINPGAALDDSIRSEIERADTFLVLYSASAKDSAWVPGELAYAQKLAASGRLSRVVLLMLDETPLPLTAEAQLQLGGNSREERNGSVSRLLNTERSVSRQS